MQTGFSPHEQSGNILFSHTPSSGLDRSSGLDNGAELLRAKLQFNWEVSLAPGQHIQKQTQWGHLSYAVHTNPPLIHPRSAIPPPCLQFQRPAVGKWVLSNQSAHTAAQAVQMGGCLVLLGILKHGKGPPTMEAALNIWLLYRKLRVLCAAGLGEKEQWLLSD